MKSNQLLQSSLLDIIFDDRNKSYGAYELRKNYGNRITKAMIITALLVGGLISLSFIQPAAKVDVPIVSKDSLVFVVVDLTKVVTPIIEQPASTATPSKTIEYTVPVIVTETDHVTEQNSDIQDAKISDHTDDGPEVTDIVEHPVVTEGPGTSIITPPIQEDVIFRAPEVDAMYEGDWIKYLNRQLNAQVPTDHDAPAGNYRVLIQFVVDVDGSISNITALTKMGYGMEEEAMRVIKKSMKWRPASQNKKTVKAYRTQPITFQVIAE